VFAVMLITPRFCFSRAASANFVIFIPSFSSGGSIFFSLLIYHGRNETFVQKLGVLG
jgi:hypothetical protein